MGVLGVHAIVYATMCLLLVLLWLMLGGEPSALARPLTGAREQGLWPFWVAAIWGTLLGMHAALTVLVRSRRQRRRARRRARTAGPRWITAMFTDIAGSTRLVGAVGDETYSDLIAAHRRTVRELVNEHHGHEVGTQGDGFLLSFPSPREALACGRELQRRLAAERERDERVPRIRVGVHAGEVIARDGDVFGRMVNIAARVADSADPDEVVVTEPVADHAEAGLYFEDRGLHVLRGVEGPRHLLALDWARTGDTATG